MKERNKYINFKVASLTDSLHFLLSSGTKLIQFEIQIHRELHRQYRDILCTLHLVPPLVRSYAIIVQYQNQEIDIGIMCVFNSVISSHDQNCVTTATIKIQDYSVTTSIPLMLPLKPIPTPFSPPTLTPNNHQLVLHLYNFVTLRILHE